jgi:putative transposase
MTLYKNKYRIESARCSKWDYSSNGWYFITICTRDRRHFFGHVKNGKMLLSDEGNIANTIWWDIDQKFSDIELNQFIVMPNHIHGLIGINRSTQSPGRDAINRVSTTNLVTNDTTNLMTNDRFNRGGITGKHNPMLSNDSISKIIRWYKGRCKFEIGKICPEFAWHPRFHDRIVRDRIAFDRIRAYIQTNPNRWKIDKFYGK